MKNLLLTVLCSLLVSFSFGQDKKPLLKENSVIAVDYLKKSLKLDAKQGVIVMNAFAEYANDMKKAIEKTAREGKADKKAIHKYMLRFALKRDNLVKECLKKKQMGQYDDLVRAIHPFTLEVKQRKKK